MASSALMARSAVHANRCLLPDACQARADTGGSSSFTNSPCSPHRRLGWCVWLMLGVEIEGVDIESLPLAPNQIKISQEGKGRLSKCMQLEQQCHASLWNLATYATISHWHSMDKSEQA